MTKRLIPIALAALLACAGCAVRMGATPAAATPAGVPRSVASEAASRPVAPDRPVVGSGSTNSPAVSALGAPPPAAEQPPTATRKAAESQAPAATTSVYVFSPKQAVSASPQALPPASSAPPAPAKAVPAPETTASASVEAAPTPGELQLLVVASASEIATGGIMTVDVMASSSTAVVDAPLHLTFDPNVVAFVDGTPGIS